MAVFVDTSALLGITFGEPGAAALAGRLRSAGQVFASPLLEAEFRSACQREGRVVAVGLLETLAWVAPSRPLHEEIARVLAAGHLRGADCWHLATALYLAPDPAELAFVTLDRRQGEVASAVGFAG